ncbi:hypothetical protein B484DRAFT_148293 [Ochromonadaceae sp. CCMP2298]|nr:hypothetical protein B484DRAFT_148293 [Ochromonadaceae sp. CCMP2298]
MGFYLQDKVLRHLRSVDVCTSEGLEGAGLRALLGLNIGTNIGMQNVGANIGTGNVGDIVTGNIDTTTSTTHTPTTTPNTTHTTHTPHTPTHIPHTPTHPPTPLTRPPLLSISICEQTPSNLLTCELFHLIRRTMPHLQAFKLCKSHLFDASFMETGVGGAGVGVGTGVGVAGEAEAGAGVAGAITVAPAPAQLATVPPQITHLHFEHCPGLSDHCILLLSLSCPLLVSLLLLDCPLLTDQSLLSLAPPAPLDHPPRLPHLKTLTLGALKLSDSGLGRVFCLNLESLTLTAVHVTDATLGCLGASQRQFQPHKGAGDGSSSGSISSSGGGITSSGSGGSGSGTGGSSSSGGVSRDAPPPGLRHLTLGFIKSGLTQEGVLGMVRACPALTSFRCHDCNVPDLEEGLNAMLAEDGRVLTFTGVSE